MKKGVHKKLWETARKPALARVCFIINANIWTWERGGYKNGDRFKEVTWGKEAETKKQRGREDEQRQRGVKDKVWKATEEGGSRLCGGVGQLSSSYPYQNLAAVQKYTQSVYVLSL